MSCNKEPLKYKDPCIPLLTRCITDRSTVRKALVAPPGIPDFDIAIKQTLFCTLNLTAYLDIYFSLQQLALREQGSYFWLF